MVFAFLFGLSMDYEVFILSRIREEYDTVQDTDGAVVEGIARTGRLVTSAALILFVGFVRAGSEAAMVGGLADWFAVTALFRRPLGLPIPHTGLVPRKKDELATKLGEFVTGHFLTREVVVAQVRDAGVVARVGHFLS